MSGNFFKAGGRPSQADVEAGWRPFTVTEECEALPVPGLNRVLGLRLGPHNVDLDMVLKLPHNKEKDEKVKIVLPYCQIDHNDDGVPCLMRTKLSNFGLWQKGQTVWVRGEWEDDPKPIAPDPKDAKKAGK